MENNQNLHIHVHMYLTFINYHKILSIIMIKYIQGFYTQLFYILIVLLVLFCTNISSSTNLSYILIVLTLIDYLQDFGRLFVNIEQLKQKVYRMRMNSSRVKKDVTTQCVMLIYLLILNTNVYDQITLYRNYLLFNFSA